MRKDALNGQSQQKRLLVQVIHKHCGRDLFRSRTGFFICRWKPWSFVAGGPIVTLLGWASLTELYDRYVGPEIFREAPPLFVQWNGAVGLAVFASVAGFIAGLRHKRSRAA